MLFMQCLFRLLKSYSIIDNQYSLHYDQNVMLIINKLALTNIIFQIIQIIFSLCNVQSKRKKCNRVGLITELVRSCTRYEQRDR